MVQVYFYNPIFTKNGDYIDIGNSILDFFDLITDKLIVDRESEKICLRQFKTMEAMINDNEDTTNRKFCFTKTRDKKPHIGDRESDSIDKINRDVYELTNVFYEYASNLFLLEYNHYGATIKDITRYLNKFLHQEINSDDEEWRLEFKEVPNDITLEYILNSPDIKGLELKIDTENNNFEYNEEDPILSKFSEAIEKIVEFNKNYGEREATFKFSRGRFKKNTMDVDHYRLIIPLLDKQQSNFKSIKLKYIDPETRKNVETNIKNIKNFKVEVDIEDNASWEISVEEIARTYLKNRVKTSEFTSFKRKNNFHYMSLPVPRK